MDSTNFERKGAAGRYRDVDGSRGVWTGAAAAQRPKAGKLDDEFAAWSSSM